MQNLITNQLHLQNVIIQQHQTIQTQDQQLQIQQQQLQLQHQQLLYLNQLHNGFATQQQTPQSQPPYQ